MARVRSVDFLPEIFQTDANKQFLSATLDQLVQEPKFKKTQGYIGRKIGPGVSPNDKYVVEPTKTREDYQLEPGIVSLDPEDTAKVQDAITYPGILDALSVQGADGSRPDRLFSSQYYTWDPFIDFDAFVNFSQYFWVPGGPNVVSVYASSVPYQENFVVDRTATAYSFSDTAGTNPILTLVRGGNYTFQVANNVKETVTLRVTSTESGSAYIINYQNNPALTLVRGNTYVFTLNLTAEYPFWIKTQPITGKGSAYNTGVTNNGASVGTVIFTVPQDAPDLLYYSAQNNTNMHGAFNIVTATETTGPKFWIQTAPGITGRNPISTNISTRSVMGVVNNGTNLGTVTFNVPSKTAQNFYYTLSDLGSIDLLTDLTFDQIDGVPVEDFLATYGGIDGIANLDTLTVTFNNSVPTAQEKIYTIGYVEIAGVQTIQLSETADIPVLNKFSIGYGTQYANTQWYKLEAGTIAAIPVLSAVQDTLYYQDSENPDIFGVIKLVEPGDNSTLDVTQIVGQKTYTSPVTQEYPNGVTFTNGLKVKFTRDVYPRSYWSGTVIVNCLETQTSVNAVVCESTQGLERNQLIKFGEAFGGIAANTDYYVCRIISDSQFSISTIKGGPALPLTNSFNVVTATATANKEFYVSGVGTAIELLPVDNFIVPETYATDANTQTVYIEPADQDYITIDRASLDLNAWSRSNSWFHIDVLYATAEYNKSFAEINLSYRAKRPIIQFRPGIRLYNMGTQGKQPVDVIDFTELDAFSNVEGSLGFTTNGYTVVNGTRIIFGADLDDAVRNKIYVVNFVEPNSNIATPAGNFRNGCRYTISVLGTTNWNIVADTQSVPSNSLVPGVTYEIFSLGNTNWNLVAGTTDVVYAVGDTFVAVTPAQGSGTCSVVYAVGDTLRAVNPGSGTGLAMFADPIINLVPADDAEVLVDQSTVCLSGTQVGKTYWYDGTVWALAQQKTGIQQPPLYNVYDSQGYSLDNKTVYPSSNFTGTKLFSYAIGSGIIDPVLQFQLQYMTLENIGDIVFDNNLYTDTFVYTIDAVSSTDYISQGYPREYYTRTDYQRLLGWQTGVTNSQTPQQFQFTYNREPFLLDVVALTDDQTVVPAIKVFVGSVFQEPSTYSVSRTENTTTISLNGVHVVGTAVEISVISNQTSSVAFYQVPTNLSQNPLNSNSDSYTLGTIRTHYESIAQNLPGLSGPINGANNIRDLGNVVPYGQLILQQSSPLTMAGYFLRSTQYNIFASLQYNSREYQKYKNRLMEVTTQQTIDYNITTSALLDTVVNEIIAGRTDSNPFYWSDMLPATTSYQTTTYTFSYTSTNTFATLYIYNYESANYQGMNVYINGRILKRGVNYVANVDSASITILPNTYDLLQVGDQITIQEYQATYGSFVPNTPTKLGLYPAYEPRVIEVKSTSGYATVIRGHDGSETPTFGTTTIDEFGIPNFTDIRDAVLLEFETRVFNNLKLDGNPLPIRISDVIPGQFRTTDYSITEVNDILGQSFLSYVGWNKLDYITQDYIPSNTFTYNYSQSLSKLDNLPLVGAWRGIYRYYYDTQQPEATPWEMLGFTVEPIWWTATYGPAPYTADNLVLWDDLEAGLVRDPAGEYILPAYARPGLSKVIPVNSNGELLSPIFSVAGVYTDNLFRKSWAVGDGGPVEASWWNSSDYPFAVMKLFALTRSAEFFALFADRDLYRYQQEFDQFLYESRYRLTTRVNANQPTGTNIQVYGNGTSKASYINWIVDYNKVLGRDSTQSLQADLANIDVRLCYRMASFSDKQYIKLYTEKSSPASTNSALLIPDESYDLVLYKNQPFARTTYSSVVVQIVNGGWAVFGYSQNNPYFETLTSIPVGQYKTFFVAGTTIQVPANYTDTVTQIPYGYVFNTTSAVANFLLSYGQLLAKDGFVFDSLENGYILDWDQMVQEFLYWSAQGWGEGTLLNLNPLAYKLSITKPLSVVDSIAAQTSENLVLDQNKQELPTRNLNIVRTDNTFVAQPLNGQSLSYIDLRFTSYESMIILNNASLFGDLIYEPITGARQNRLILIAATTTEWNGSVDAQGFVFNQNNVEEWTGLRTYAKGEIVKYKNQYWSAATIVQPTTEFNYNDWNQSNYSMIQKGLLPNLANKANQLANSYNINSANLESDNDLLSYGLIGFRPRQYFTALNLDDVSQLNVYRQFIDTKGTILSADLLTQAQLDKEAADYTIYENWAIQRGVYGANANRNFIDLRLNREYLNSDPVLVQIVEPGQSSIADQSIMTTQVWKSSTPVVSANVFPTTTVSITDVALPSAGYVNIDDVDITVFQMADIGSLSQNIDSIQNGTKIWVAKVNDYDWGVYRAQSIPGSIQHVCDNLNGTSRVIFSDFHGLSVNDTLIIKFFSTEINGVYKVLAVVDPTTVNIAFSFVGGQTVANGNGIGFSLQTMRVAQASDIDTLPYANQLLPGNMIWVDDDSNAQWEVLKKQNPFVSRSLLEPTSKFNNGQYGSSVSQATNQTALFVGSPYFISDSEETGGIYVYFNSYSRTYIPLTGYTGLDQVLLLGATGTRHFGSSVDFGSIVWAAAGAPKSLGPTGTENTGYTAIIRLDLNSTSQSPNPYLVWQLLTMPGTTNVSSPGAGKFGYSVAVSSDERWAYVGAPGINQVYAYGLVPWQIQIKALVTTTTTATFYIADTIQINNPLQATVKVDGTLLTYGIDYTYEIVELVQLYDTVVFTVPVAANQRIVVERNNSIEKFGGTTTFQVSDYLYGATSLYSCSVLVDSVIQRPGIDYYFNSMTGSIEFYSAIPVESTVYVRAQDYFEYAGAMPCSAALDPDSQFGASLQCSSDGRQLIIGCPGLVVDGLENAGSVFIIDRNVQSFIVRASDTSGIFTPLGTMTGPVSVKLNGKFLTNETNSIINGADTFKIVGSTVVITNGVAVGDVVEIETNQFVEQQQIFQNTVEKSAVFGHAVALCPYNCSLYVGAPQSSMSAWEGGVVQRSVSQSALYGTITATVANPVLTVGNTIRINDVDVAVPDAPLNTVEGLAAAINGHLVGLPPAVPNATATVVDGYLTIATTNFATAPIGKKLKVSPGTIGTDYNSFGFEEFVYTQTIASPLPSNFAGFGSSIDVNDSALTIVVGSPKANLYLLNTFDYSSALQEPTTIFDGNGTTFYSPTEQSGAVYTFDFFPSANSSVSNPGKFVFGQQVANNVVKNGDLYGTSVNYTAGVLVAGAPDHNPVVTAGSFVVGKTYTINTIGAVVPAGLFVIGSTYVIRSVGNTDFIAVGAASNTVGLSFVATGRGRGTGNVYQDPTDFTLIGATANKIGISFVATGDGSGTGTAYQMDDNGAVFSYQNPNRIPAWDIVHKQQPVVDIHLLNSVFMYDRLTGAKSEFFDYIDPLQGKILGAAQENLDYIGAVDPAEYNVGYVNNNGNSWARDHVSEMWWDISTVRFLDPNQGDIVYAARRWAQVFPGSVINVYQWVESTQPPASYVGPGTPRSIDSYVVKAQLTQTGTINTLYYFWVKNVTVTYTDKTLSAVAVAQYIESPKSSGISYVAPVNASTIAIYNGLQYVNAADTILSVEYDQELNQDNVHVEYELIAQGRPQAFLSDSLYRKLLDSFCGVDTAGNKVPDSNLPVSQQYGVLFRPRQSMFVQRLLALQNYIVRTNIVLSLYPIREIRNFPLLYSQEPELTQTEVINGNIVVNWNLRVANLDILGYQDIYAVPLDYKYLVVSDSNNSGLWTIYTVTTEFTGSTTRRLLLSRVQNYKTSDYWSFIDWYAPGFNKSSKVSYQVPNYASLALLNAPMGSVAKVTANAQGLFELYLLSDAGWSRVGLQNGTIEISAKIYDYALGRFGFDGEVFDAQYFDQEPTKETRMILMSINQELLIDELYIERNKLLTLMFDFILSEQEAPEWLTKTSLIDVQHTVRELIPYPNYRVDNQTFVSDYLQEVKPYHVQVREFNLSYNGLNVYQGDATDFDVPAYFDSNLEIAHYVSPILTPYAHSTAQTFNTDSDTPITSTVWSEWPYSQWIANYQLSVQRIQVIDGGTGYVEPPVIDISGTNTVQAEAYAVVDGFGHVVEIVVTSNGAGYSATPTVNIISGTGTGASAYPVMVNRSPNDLKADVYNVYPAVTLDQWEQQTGTSVALTTVRSPKIVIKYDRFQYQTTVVDWSRSATYVTGDVVRYNNAIWEATTTSGPDQDFSFAQWQIVNPATVELEWDPVQNYYIPVQVTTGVDRTMGYYTPGINMPGLELPLLVDGVEYPGVQVFGKEFISTNELDTDYRSAFTDMYLGTRISDVNVDGGQFIGPYEGHAPEELVNGAEFDTFDFRIYTRPGSDWAGDGHGFNISSLRYLVTEGITTYSYAGLEYPVEVSVGDVTTGLMLNLDIDYVIHWADQTIELLVDLDGHTINIDVFEIGSGSQLYRETYIGEMAETLVIPVNSGEIDAVIFFVNGVPYPAAQWRPWYDPATAWNIAQTYEFNDVVYDTQYRYFRAIKSVSKGTSLNNFEYWQTSGHPVEGQLQFTGAFRNTLVTLPVTPTAQDSTTVAVMGTTALPQLSWSTPMTQYVTVDSNIQDTRIISLQNYFGGTNPANLIVLKNGLRLKPAAGIEWIADGSTTSFGLPQQMGISQELINASTDITVYLNNVLLQSGLDYTVTAWTGSNVPGRQVVLSNTPETGSVILISVSTIADYTVSIYNKTLTLNATPQIGDIVAVTTFNDTADQQLVTLVFAGSAVIETQGYNLGAADLSGSRLFVTLDGRRLFDGIDYDVQGQYLIIASGTIQIAQTLVVTKFAKFAVPDEVAFRIFQDMRGIQATYRITDTNSTMLEQNLAADEDIIYVKDASVLGAPDVDLNIFGVITINGERIMYRYRDVVTNTVSGLWRGTAGTAVAAHTAGAEVTDMGRTSMLMMSYQDYISKTTVKSDGTATEYSATNLDIEYIADSGVAVADVVEVYVAGIRQLTGYSVSVNLPVVTVVFDTAPIAGVEVTIAVKHGVTWYQRGINTPSDGVALQETNTQAARFLCGH